MATLCMLGGARLEGDAGRLAGEPAQRHRIALLALLALAPDHRLPREKLMALLWPEHAPGRARHLLNVSVHVLRKALGRAALRTEGDDLRLDSAHLTSDVHAFRDAVDRGDVRGATDLYSGPFLDGFFLDDAPEFERWQEAERAQLVAVLAAALEARAGAAERDGDRQEALACWRRLAALRPEDERAAMRLMELLEVEGDRAGALRAAAAHAAVMEEEFGMELGPAVVELTERIRRVPPAGRPAAASHARRDPAADSVSAAEPAPAPEADPGADPAAEAAPLHAPAAPGPPAAATSSRRARGRRRAVRSWVLLGAGTVVAAVAFASLGAPAADPAPASVAVLPFENLSPAADQAYLSDGLTAELLNALARIPWLHVAARSSVFQLHDAGEDVRTIGRRLNVAAVLQGTVRLDGDRLRVAARLVDARTGYYVWSQQYDRRVQEVFAVQEEIADAVASALGAELARQLPDTLIAATTSNPAAYQLYLQGRHEWRKRTEAGMWNALRAFREAIALDPAYAAAYAGLSDAWQLLPDYGDVPTHEGLARAKTAALRAIALDSTLAAAHASLGALLDDYDRDRAGAEAAYRRAIELNPGYATAHHWLAIHLADDGRFAEALAEIERARRLDPLSLIVNTAAGAVRYFARDYQGAIAEYRAVLDQDPQFALAWGLLGRVQLVDGQVDAAVASLRRSVELSDGDPSYRAVYAAALAAAGDAAEAGAIANELRLHPPGGYLPYCELASAYLYLGDDAHALDLFERAFEERDPALKHIDVEPLYDRIRDHPRFHDLLRRAGFSADQVQVDRLEL